MKPKTMILMAVAIVCGLGASYMTSRLLAERDDQPQAPQPVEIPKVKILVAKAKLDHGTAIKNPEDLFVEKSVAQDDERVKVGVSDPKLLKGKFLKRNLRKDDHVTNEDLMDERTSILATLPDGYQAYGIQVDTASIAGGFASLPGSKVNIIWTVRRGDDNQSFARILLQDVLVLAADTRSTRDEEGKAMPASVVTVALKESDTIKVKLAQSYGPLTLTLRKYGDQTPAPEKFAFNGKDLFESQLDAKKKSPLPETTKEEEDPLKEVPNVAQEKKVEPKRYFHVVNFRQGDKQWRQVIEVDEKGAPVHDDGQGNPTPPPAVEQAPPQATNPPAANKDEGKGAAKNNG